MSCEKRPERGIYFRVDLSLETLNKPVTPLLRYPVTLFPCDYNLPHTRPGNPADNSSVFEAGVQAGLECLFSVLLRQSDEQAAGGLGIEEEQFLGIGEAAVPADEMSVVVSVIERSAGY